MCRGEIIISFCPRNYLSFTICRCALNFLSLIIYCIVISRCCCGRCSRCASTRNYVGLTVNYIRIRIDIGCLVIKIRINIYIISLDFIGCCSITYYRIRITKIIIAFNDVSSSVCCSWDFISRLDVFAVNGVCVVVK